MKTTEICKINPKHSSGCRYGFWLAKVILQSQDLYLPTVSMPEKPF